MSNATAAITVAHELGIAPDAIKKGLLGFGGVIVQNVQSIGRIGAFYEQNFARRFGARGFHFAQNDFIFKNSVEIIQISTQKPIH